MRTRELKESQEFLLCKKLTLQECWALQKYIDTIAENATDEDTWEEKEDPEAEIARF